MKSICAMIGKTIRVIVAVVLIVMFIPGVGQWLLDAMERAVAGKQLKASYKESDSIKTQRPVIESQKYMSGYA